MAYFNHAFKKEFLVKQVAAGDEVVLSTKDTVNLTAGELGFYDAKKYVPLAAPDGAKPFFLAQGSYLPYDKVGSHGGHKESIKSKVINPKYISRVYLSRAVPPCQQIVEVGACSFECGETYRLRLDLKGAPALRFLSHNIYKTLDAFGGCCDDDCAAGCTGDCIDPVIINKQWADQINNDPILKNFIRAKVSLGGTIMTADALEAYVPVTDPVAACALEAKLRLYVAYADTRFGQCTFDINDYYGLQPLQIYASLVDESGNPCAGKCHINSSTKELVTEIQAPVQANVTGETVAREAILDHSYRQDYFRNTNTATGLRQREIEGVGEAINAVNRAGLYDQLFILHSVPRFNNPTGTFDTDQYLIAISAEAKVTPGVDCACATVTNVEFANIIAFLEAALLEAGNPVEIENYTPNAVTTGDKAGTYTWPAAILPVVEDCP